MIENEKFVFINEEGEEIEIHNSRSFNKGKPFLKSILPLSIKMLGCSRSVVIDAQNKVLCGTKVLPAVYAAGIKRVRIIETDGNELIVVKRADVKSGTKKAYDISLVDNLAQSRNLEWDADEVVNAMQSSLSFNPRDWGGSECVVKELNIEELLKDEVEVNTKKVKQKNEQINDVQYFSLFD